MSSRETKTDVILIGAGIMSATLGTLLKELVPDWKIKVFEKLGNAGEESSNEWNNAGTGHAALCELNYTKKNRTDQWILAKPSTLMNSFSFQCSFGRIL